MSFKKSNPFVKKWKSELEDSTRESVAQFHSWNKYGQTKSYLKASVIILISLCLGAIVSMILTNVPYQF